MRDYLTSHDISNTISMMRTAFDGTILVVEGITDMRLYGRFTNHEKSEIIIAHSREKVVQSVTENSGRRKDTKILGITDADLDRMRGKNVKPPLFVTDYRDSESTMISSEALKRVLWEYGDKDKIEAYERTHGPILDKAMEAAYPLGLLMFISDKRGYKLSFKDLNFRAFIDKNMKCDLKLMINEVLNNSRYRSVDFSTLMNQLKDEISKNRPFSEVCRGHDLVDVLVIGFRDIFGAYNASKMNEGGLGGALRLSYDDSDFVKTNLYKDTSAWCEKTDNILWNV